MSSEEMSKLVDVTADILNKIIEEDKRQTNIIKDTTKEERLNGVYNKLNSNEISLFKQLANVNREGLDNFYSDSFGNKRHEEQEKYNQMAKLHSKESVEKVEYLYKENIYDGMDKTPDGKISYSDIENVEKNMYEQTNFHDAEKSIEEQPEFNLEKETNNEMNYKQKIEQTLRDNSELFKKALAVTQIYSMKKHLESSKDILDKLNAIKKDDPIEQHKIDDMKLQLTTHVKGMEQELNSLEKSHNPEQTMDSINAKTENQERENNNEKPNDKVPANTKKQEKNMER